ncbi:MAG: T9SS type A sorting domain-containing protein [Flavobacteriaceae bacterium]
MKKITFLLLALTFGFFTAQAQVISLIGDAVGGWSTDVDLSTTDNNIYTATGVTLVNGGVKFRQDHDWPNNWGGTAFPSGTGVFNSSDNIPAIAGTYDVTFNLTTLAYEFINNSSFTEVGIIGSAINGGSTDDTDMNTTDGIVYFLNAINVTTGDAHFRQDNAEIVNWSDSAFPSGTGTQDGTVIPVTANDYNITFNLTSGAYSFDFLDISLIGGFNSWSGDVDLTTSDGENYSLNNFVLAADGQLKLRQNHDWNTSWGDSSTSSGNIELLADTYNVTFVRSTGVYTFTSTTASITGYNNLNTSIKLYPTIADQSFQSNKTIDVITIYNINGKVVKTFNGNFEEGYHFKISDLSPAMYYVTLESSEGNNIQHLYVK